MNTAACRQALFEIYQAAVTAVDGCSLTRNVLRSEPLAGPVWLIAIGKAAGAMAAGALDVIGDQVSAGLVVGKHGLHSSHSLPDNIQVLQAAHPVPDTSSLAAGRELVEFIDAVPADGQLLVLISGGTSALVEQLPSGLDIGVLQQINAWLLGSGFPIQSINRVRKVVSAIKAGRLAERVASRPVRCLMLSDVPGDDVRDIGSGLLTAHQPDDLDLGALDLPQWFTKLHPVLAPLPSLNVFNNIELHIIGTAAMARDAAQRAAQDQGWPIFRHDELIVGNASDAGYALANALLAGGPGLHIYSGETTVVLPDSPGVGGRCQHLALSAAKVLAGKAGHYVLAAGSDGDDGSHGPAGGLIDANTIQRGAELDQDADASLLAADAGRFLQHSGDLLVTGPSDTNVMDIILGLALPG